MQLDNWMYGRGVAKRLMSSDPIEIHGTILKKKSEIVPININIPPTGYMECIGDIFQRPKIIKRLLSHKDAYVTDFAPTYNYGSRSQMRVGIDANGNKLRSLITFDLSTLQDNLTLVSATLKLRVATPNHTCDMFELSTLNKHWDEYGVTWANQPIRDQFVDIVEVDKTSEHITMNVTDIIKEWYSDGRIDGGFLIKEFEAYSYKEMSFFTRESGELAPILEIEYFDPTFSLPRKNYLDINITVKQKKNISIPVTLNVLTYKKESFLDISLFTTSIRGELRLELAVSKPQIPIGMTVLCKKDDSLPINFTVSQYLIDEQVDINFSASRISLPVQFNVRTFNELFMDMVVHYPWLPVNLFVKKNTIPINMNVAGISYLDITGYISRISIPVNLNVRTFHEVPVTGTILTKQEVSLPIDAYIHKPCVPIQLNVGVANYVPIEFKISTKAEDYIDITGYIHKPVIPIEFTVGFAKYIPIVGQIKKKLTHTIPIQFSYSNRNLPVYFTVRQYSDLLIKCNIPAENNIDLYLIVKKFKEDQKDIVANIRAVSQIPITADVRSRFLDVEFNILAHKQTFKNMSLHVRAIKEIPITAYVQKGSNIIITMNIRQSWFNDLDIRFRVDGVIKARRAYAFIL